MDNNLRSCGGELAVANRCRGTLVAAVRAVEVGTNCYMAGNTGTEGRHCHGD